MQFKGNPVSKIFGYFNFFMVAVYLGLGLLFLCTDIAIELFPVYRKPVGGIMLLYAAYRGYTTYRKIKKSESQN